jgi:hypothetical protein
MVSTTSGMLAEIFMLTFLGLQEVREQYSAATAGNWWTRYVQKFSLAPSRLTAQDSH